MRAPIAAAGCAALSIMGLAICGVLLYVHLGLVRGELLGGVACGEAAAFNCHAVVGSVYGAAFGVPLAIWGLAGYVVAFSLAALALIMDHGSWMIDDGKDPPSTIHHPPSTPQLPAPSGSGGALTLLAGLALLFVGIDLYLLWVMAGVIGEWCPLCLATYGVNVAMLVVAAWGAKKLEAGSCLPALRSAGQAGKLEGKSFAPNSRLLAPRRGVAALSVLVPGRGRPAAWAFWGMLALGLAGSFGVHAATQFVSYGSPADVRKRIRGFVGQQTPQRVETAQDPALGPADAPVQVVEFSDFLCPICRKAAKMNAVLLAGRRSDVRFVFKNFPLDAACNPAVSKTVHPGACQAAAVAECAHQQGKFWPFHDLLFEKGKNYRVDSLEGDARRLGLDVERFRGCLASGEGLAAVQRDVAEAGRLGLRSTPVYFINGIRFDGVMTPAVFEVILEVLGSREASDE